MAASLRQMYQCTTITSYKCMNSKVFLKKYSLGQKLYVSAGTLLRIDPLTAITCLRLLG